MYLDYLAQLEDAERRYQDKCRERHLAHMECQELHREIVRLYNLMSLEAGRYIRN